MNTSLNKKGFTLVELLIVLIIIAIITAIAIPTLYNEKKDLKKDVFILYNNLQYAKMYAIKNRTNVTITFNLTNNYYTMQLDNNTKTVYLNENVEFGDGGHSNLSNHKVAFDNTNPPKEIFTPLGFPKYFGSIYIKLKNSSDYVYLISINLNGKITIKKWDGQSFVE